MVTIDGNDVGAPAGVVAENGLTVWVQEPGCVMKSQH
jgi:hypothetical protein